MLAILYNTNLEDGGEMILKVEYSFRLEEIEHTRKNNAEFSYLKQRNRILHDRFTVRAKYCLQMWETLITGRSLLVSLNGGERCTAFNSTICE